MNNISTIAPDEHQEVSMEANTLKTTIDETYAPKKRWGVFVAFLLILVLLFSLAYFGFHSYQNHRDSVKSSQNYHKPLTTSENKATPLGVEGESIKSKPETLPLPQEIQVTPMPAPIGIVETKPIETVPTTPKVSHYDAPLMLGTPSETGQIASSNIPVTGNVVGTENSANLAIQDNNSQSKSTEGMRLTPTATPKSKALMLGNRNYILAKGGALDCGLNTAIVSTIPGMVTCTLTSNAYSANGKVVLLERGSQITGEYTGIKQGEIRMAVLWDRIRTPDGVVIDVNSLGTDQLGRGGFDGEIDKHWGERIGAAFLMSTFKDLVAYKTAKDSNANVATPTYQNTQNTSNDLASQILKQTINMPPTLIKNQGERVGIVVARDLDFSGVYGFDVTDHD